MFHGFLGCVLRRHLGGERSAFARPFEASRSSTSPANRITLVIGYCYYRIIKTRKYMDLTG
jgi:hypothetical protein